MGPPTRCASNKSRSREVERKITEALRREEHYFLRKYFDARALSQMAVFAALYSVLVWVLPGLSFAAAQFRIAEGLKPAIAKKWI
ncbi:QueT transporter family protein [Candidatus Bathyarchaeota archaeon]|nr:MAG: QueT transporter family protein [Candidatus Bathyarchaeota archaeon]